MHRTPAQENEEKRRYEAKSRNKLRAFPSLASKFQTPNGGGALSAKLADSSSVAPDAAADEEQASSPSGKSPAAPKRKRHKKKKSATNPSGGTASPHVDTAAAAVAPHVANAAQASSSQGVVPKKKVKSEPISQQTGTSGGATSAGGAKQRPENQNQAEQPASARKRRPRKRRAGAGAGATPADRPDLSESRLRAYGIDPRKYRFLPLHKKPVAPQQPQQKQPSAAQEEKAAGVARVGPRKKKIKRESPSTA